MPVLMTSTFCLLCALVLSDSVLGETFTIGQFSVDRIGNHIRVNHVSDFTKIVWQTSDEVSPFLKAGYAVVQKPPILDGNFQMEEEITYTTTWQSIETANIDVNETSLVIAGTIGCDTMDTIFSYTFRMSISDVSPQYLIFDAHLSSPTTAVNRLFLSYWSDGVETFHGFGESFTDFTMNGRRIPVLVSEQGVGRGTEPITAYLNSGTEGVGGHW